MRPGGCGGGGYRGDGRVGQRWVGKRIREDKEALVNHMDRA